MKQLIYIQENLKAKKSQFNKFGNYSYRSAEDIIKAVKPLLTESKTALTMNDEIMEVAGAVFVKATVKLFDNEGKLIAGCSASAKHALQQKGMSDPQITGSASSYARKYALGGLFAVDDGIDADHQSQHVNNNQADNQQGNW